MSDFNPSRLAIARRRRGLTKRSLAGAIGVTARAIAEYERGTFPPSEEKLRALSAALSFPEAFFRGADLERVALEGASFRSLSKMTATQRSSVLAAGSLALEANRILEQQLELPPPDAPDLHTETPEAAAELLRAQWQLGLRPIGNVVHLLEAHGVRVFSLAEDCVEVDAFSLWAGGTPFVFLNTKKSGERGRFDAAHELGHLVLHRHGPPEGRKAEHQANRFASAFLMPRAAVLASAPRFAALDRLLVLKRTWKVSVAALARRLYDLGVTSQWHYEQTCIEIARRGWRTEEPEGIEREVSQLLPKAFAALATDKLDLAITLAMNSDDLAELTFGAAKTGDRTRTAHLRLVR